MRIIVFCFLIVSFIPLKAAGYSVLSHEAIIDVSWDKSIRPLLLRKFPGTTETQLKEARAYAYGGSVVADMGYYPKGDKLFTDLVHYVRSGDFVVALFEEARDVNEYAFACGALCHYHADRYGHAIGINPGVPLIYPKVGRRYGAVVTYEQHPRSHIRTEFGFDVLQTARGNYASEQYHDFIGFKVARPVLERAFKKTYGLDMNDLFKDLDKTIATYRWATLRFFPLITRVAWANKKREIQKSQAGITRRRFEYRMQRPTYYREYGKKHYKPGFLASVAALVLKIVPKVGPLKNYKIKVPNAAAERLFIKSFDTTVARCAVALKYESENKLTLKNIDYDTGNETCPGEYILADKNYSILLLKLKERNFSTVTPALRQNIISFYAHAGEKTAEHIGPIEWTRIMQALDELKALRLSKR